ncbi:hypothetical protein [Oscillibacter sp.]|uniref:hypothetical protein n=3 Tax=unclassified Oscillibacter TaxID=2629304 RepID=UPI00289A059A|nr:hypothetical protein [Oscillibacter sp.]
MAEIRDKKPYDALTDAEDLTAGTDVIPEGDFSLEEILAEYGGGRRRHILDEAEALATPELEAQDEALTDGAETAFALPPQEESESDELSDEEALPDADLPDEEDFPVPEEILPSPPRPVSIEQAVGQTVGDVMEAQESLTAAQRPRRGLFSRKKIPLEDTEQLYEPPGPPPEPEPEEPPVGPEPPLDEAMRFAQKRWRRLRRPLPVAALICLLLLAPQAAEAAGYTVPLWTGDGMLQTAVSAGALLLLCILCRGVFVRGGTRLAHKFFTGELLLSFSAVVALLDCAAVLWLPGRSAVPLYALPACVGLFFGQWGISQREKARSDTFRTAALDLTPPYLVTDLETGACKQPGRVPGFWSDAEKPSLSEIWQAALLPVVFVASVVFAALGSVGQGRNADFLLNWSAILAASAALMLPMTDALPAARLAKRLQKGGCAVAGCAGAERISRKKSMVVTDQDLFPPGTVSLNGVKLFGEEMPRAVSYAASLARSSGCGLRRLFDNLLVSEGGTLESLDDFSFYEEGGFSAAIRGESVLLGTASFMRKMDVRLPSGLNLRTGVFLSIDRELAAVFAVKYKPSDNVDWALRLLRRNKIQPILASRDPNVNPGLLKRKFTAKVKIQYPTLSDRVAFSEQESAQGRPRALLLREGLLPYAETVTGSRRLCRAVRSGTALTLLASVAGSLLSFYLTGLGSYALMEPLRLLAFSLLWTVPVFLLDHTAGRY